MPGSQSQELALEEPPNPGWYPLSYPPKIARAYAELQELLRAKGYTLADTMDPRGQKAVEAKTARCLFDIMDISSTYFPEIILDLIPRDLPRVCGLGVRYLAPNARLASHLEKYLHSLRNIKRGVDEEPERADAIELGSQQARKPRQDAIFWKLSGGHDVVEALLKMDVEPSQASSYRDDGSHDSIDAEIKLPSINEATVDYRMSRATPTKRLTTTVPPGSPCKKTRADGQSPTAAGLSTDTDHDLPPVALGDEGLLYDDNTAHLGAGYAINDRATNHFRRVRFLAAPPCSSTAERDVLVVPATPLQDELNSRDVPFYLQWEMSRMISRHPTVTWGDVTSHDLDFFRTPNAALGIAAWLETIADRRAGVDIGGRKPTLYGEVISARQRRMLLELQREELAIRQNDLRGVLNPSPDWSFGGKIAFVVTVLPASARSSDKIVMPRIENPPRSIDDNPFDTSAGSKSANTLPFHMTLAPLDMPGKSFRLARRFGSRRVLQFRLKDFKTATLKCQLMDLFVGRRLVLFGRTFRVLWSPPDRDSVFAIETPEGYSGNDPAMPTFAEVLAMYNDMDSKPSQAMAKWAARPQIIFSDSVPVVELPAGRIGSARDIVSSQAGCYEQATTEQILTDGCGLMSQSLARRLRLTSSGPPSCAVQVRLGGAKGMLVVMNDDQERQFVGKDVILRDSMIKALPDSRFANDPSLLTIDLVRFDSLRIGTTLSSEAILVLHHGGVPAETLLRMSAHSLDELKRDFLPAPLEGEKPEHVLLRLVNSCFRQGGIGLERKKRLYAAEGSSLRAAGLESGRYQKGREADMPDMVADELISPAEQYDIDPVNKQPGSLAESLMMALASGFHPRTSQYTSQKLHSLVSTLSDTMIRKFQISVEKSITAFIVPDSLQILKPDEIFVSFSTRLPVDPDTQCHISHLEGPVLAFRSPCELPTDVRKFTAVYRPELAYLKDCVVMSASTQLCARSPASYLGGGDYDGDTVQVIWDRALVDSFSNASDEHVVVPDDFVSENFEKEVLKVGEFLQALGAAGADEETKIANQQRYLLGAIEDDMSTGNYSDLHGSAIYELGLDHPETIRLACMFCHVLDARKSGLKVKREVMRRDDKRYGYQVAWRNWKKDIVDTRNRLDLLMQASIAHRGMMMASFPKEIAFDSACEEDYHDLSRLWLSVQAELRDETASEHFDPALEPAPSPLARDAQTLEQHVRICYAIWRQVREYRLLPGGMAESYAAHLAEAAAGRAPPRTPSRRFGVHTPKRNGQASTAGEQNVLLRLTQMRELAVIWRDRLRVEEVPGLCFFGDEDSLRRMKVSCGASVERYRKKQVFVFDMDFETACELKAKASGCTTTVLENVFTSMKTEYKRPVG